MGYKKCGASEITAKDKNVFSFLSLACSIALVTIYHRLWNEICESGDFFSEIHSILCSDSKLAKSKLRVMLH